MDERADKPGEFRVLVLAPTATDGALSKTLLAEAGFECVVCDDARALSREIDLGVGAVLLTEETWLDRAEPLIESVAAQPEWSDLPILLLAHLGADSPAAVRAIETLGNITVLERPVRVVTLITALRTALKARGRQYELRDRLNAMTLLASVVESSDDAIISKTLDGTITSWNSGAERIFGYPSAEAIGKPITMIIPKERRSEEEGIVARLRRGERIEHFETVRVTKSGLLIDISLTISPIRDQRGFVVGASKIARDVTVQKRIREALRESEERFRFVAETVPSIIWTAGADGTITYANRRWKTYTGVSIAQDPQSLPAMFLHPDDRERTTAKWAAHVRDGVEYENEARHRRHDGVYRWFVTRAFPLLGSDRRVMSWFGVTTDIHERKTMEESLREADRRKDEFLATLAHELRNPLAPIRNSLQIIRRARADSAAYGRALPIIERQVDHLVRLVDDLLEVSRISRGKIELRRERVELAPVIRHAVETVGPLIAEAGLELSVALPAEPIFVDGDAIRLAQVIDNLLNNAAKYTEKGGRVALAVRRDGGDVVIAVRDTGIGIPAELLPRLFDMFVQGDHASTRAKGGLGIGLTLVRNLVELHGGSIEATSEGRGRGSEFIVRIPAASQVEQPARVGRSVQASASGESGQALRILVVDDNVDSAQSLGMLLELMGHDVELAFEGMSALDAARQRRPEMVFLDLGMPQLDGYEVARKLRNELHLDEAVLIALTGYGREQDRERTRASGFDGHLVKPVSPAMLESVLAGYARKVAARRIAQA